MNIPFQTSLIYGAHQRLPLQTYLIPGIHKELTLQTSLTCGVYPGLPSKISRIAELALDFLSKHL